MATTKEQLCDFYVRSLHSESGAEAIKYLNSRCIDDKTIADFKLGWCPQEWAGHPIWRRRVIFPLIDAHGIICGFSGRLLTYTTKDTDGNTLTGEVGTNRLIKKIDKNGVKEEFGMIQFHDSFPKKYFLYGLNQAIEHIRKQNYAIIVEGQSDLLSMHSQGFRNTVATMGSALSLFHVVSLYRYCDFIILMFDADSGGQNAIELAKKRIPLSYASLKLPDGYDPNAFIKEFGSKDIKNSISQIFESKKRNFEDIFEEKSTEAQNMFV
jgi:DNA primase